MGDIRAGYCFLSCVIHDFYICLFLQRDNLSAIGLARNQLGDSHKLIFGKTYSHVLNETFSLWYLLRKPKSNALEKGPLYTSFIGNTTEDNFSHALPASELHIADQSILFTGLAVLPRANSQ